MTPLTLERRAGPLLIALVFSAGCGKTASDPSEQDGGVTSVEMGGAPSGGSGLGGGATGEAGGRGSPADCPRGRPTDGDSCDVVGPCEYDVVDKGCCVELTTARCVDGVWDLSEIDCDCPTDGTGGTGAGGAASDACDANDDCLVTLKACCEPCAVSTADDYVALNRGAVADYDAAKCATDSTCPPCIAIGTQSVVATCNAGRCEVVDLSNDVITSCSTNNDCLIVTRECCECGADVESLAAINRSTRGDLETLVCGPATGCDGCVPTLPSWKVADCIGGACEIAYVY